MPMRRRPVGPHRPRGNPPMPPPFARPSPHPPIPPTVLTVSFAPVPPPTKLPPRPIGNHPGGTILTIPTVGPLPSLPQANPTIFPPPIAPPVRGGRRPLVSPVMNTGFPIGRPPRGIPGQIPIRRW